MTSNPARLMGKPRAGRQSIPEASVARLPVYLRALSHLAAGGVSTVSSEELAAAAGVGPAKLRKDLSYLGSYGVRGVGYEVDYLLYQISRELGLSRDWRVVIAGAGHLGHALANYGGFASRGFRVVAMLESDDDLVGREIAGIPVHPVDDLERVVAEYDVQIAVVATPAESAQRICDRLTRVGVTSVLNFAPCLLEVPDGVMVRKVDLSTELQILAFHEQRHGSDPIGTDPIGTDPIGTDPIGTDPIGSDPIGLAPEDTALAGSPVESPESERTGTR